MRGYGVLLVKSLLGGGLIGIGGVVYLSVDSKVLGSLLFAIGLFTILYGGLALFTGRVGTALQDTMERGPAALAELGIVLLGNLVGAAAIGLVCGATRFGPALRANALALTGPKCNDTWWSLLVLAVFCGVMVYIAATGFRAAQDGAHKLACVLFPVVVFILAGFEHCIADAFYVAMAGAWGWPAVRLLALVTVGNSLGGLLAHELYRLTKPGKKA